MRVELLEEIYSMSFEEAKAICLDARVYDKIQELADGRFYVEVTVGELGEEWEEGEVLEDSEDIFKYATNIRKILGEKEGQFQED